LSTSIVRVLTRLGAGGPPIHAVTLTRELSKLGYSSILVTGSNDRDDGDMSYLLRDGDPVYSIPEMSRSVSPWQDLRALIALYRFLRRERPSIVHTHTAKAGVLGRIAARLAGVPVVVHTFHGNVLDHYFPRPVSWAIRQVERMLARFTDGICVLASQQASELADKHHIAPPDKIHLIPLGMDLSAFGALPPARRTGGRITVGWMGRFVPIKEHSIATGGRAGDRSPHGSGAVRGRRRRPRGSAGEGAGRRAWPRPVPMARLARGRRGSPGRMRPAHPNLA
jgi:hypothetical protein